MPNTHLNCQLYLLFVGDTSMMQYSFGIVKYIFSLVEYPFNTVQEKSKNVFDKIALSLDYL